jgi:hypothetical protein
VHVSKGDLVARPVLDGRPVNTITAFLFHRGGNDSPAHLGANAGLSFSGAKVYGQGFIFDDADTKGVATKLAEMRRLIAEDPRNQDVIFPYKWFPAVENRGEGVFLQIRADAVEKWLRRPEVMKRLDGLTIGHKLWMEDRKAQRPFPGGPYVLLHTLSHLLIQSLAMRCGYPASSIRERIYADAQAGHFGILLYTGSPDADGTLGGLVQEARHMEDHLLLALRMGALCSNDPICAQHAPGGSMEKRWLHGAACHGCALVAETSCEMRNDYLDRALVVPVLGIGEAAFFGAVA